MKNDISYYISSNSSKYPQIYVYEDKTLHPGWFKVGYTTRKNVKDRVREQYNTAALTKETYNILHFESAIKADGVTVFFDTDVHKQLVKLGATQETKTSGEESEWFSNCTLDMIKTVINAVKFDIPLEKARSASFKMRKEQEDFVNGTFKLFTSGKSNKALWNAKMRFGKCFATAQLAVKMGFKHIMIYTDKPAVEDSWRNDIQSHIDFKDYDFISVDKKTNKFEKPTKDKYFCFVSGQNAKGTDSEGLVKEKNKWLYGVEWDLVAFDESHYGVWNDSNQSTFSSEGATISDDIDVAKIHSKYFLYLSGTPFRALSNGEFIEEQVFNWTYSDEQDAKKKFEEEHPDEYNPYASLPEMIFFTYKLPSTITNNILDDCNEFDLNEFFKAERKEGKTHFKYASQVKSWLNCLYTPAIMKVGINIKEDPPVPFADPNLTEVLAHIVFYMSGRDECDAMENMLTSHPFFKQYKVINLNKCGDGIAAKKYLDKEMKDEAMTITLSCGKLMTGVTVKPWSGIFMLLNLQSPETYFQSAFRIQSPYTVKDKDGKEVILKTKCCVFDFSPNRTLKQIAAYADKLNPNDSLSVEEKVEKFIEFLPVLAYSDQGMQEMNAKDICDWAYSGTTATLLTKGWESASLINLDSNILKDILNDPDALNAIMKIEGFRALGTNSIQTVISKTEKLKALRNKAREEKLSEEEKKEIKKLESDLNTKDSKNPEKGMRKQIQEKLMKFATRLPIFMYLTDEREKCLIDIVRGVEKELFEKVTGLTVKDFDKLVSLGLFNKDLMNQAIYNFKAYENPSLLYIGSEEHKQQINNRVEGLWNTTVKSDFSEKQEKKDKSFNNIKETL